MLLLSTDRTSGALGPVLGSPVQNKHRHTGDQQQATNMVRDWSTCHKRMAERAGTVQPPEKMFQQGFYHVYKYFMRTSIEGGTRLFSCIQ